MQITQVKSSLFTLSLAGPGQIKQGIDFINQNIEILLLTPKGGDPLRPEFGCDARGKIDQPINKVRGSLINDVKNALNTFIPEIVVVKIVPTILVGQMTIKVTWAFATQALIEEFQTKEVTYYKQAA